MRFKPKKLNQTNVVEFGTVIPHMMSANILRKKRDPFKMHKLAMKHLNLEGPHDGSGKHI